MDDRTVGAIAGERYRQVPERRFIPPVRSPLPTFDGEAREPDRRHPVHDWIPAARRPVHAQHRKKRLGAVPRNRSDRAGEFRRGACFLNCPVAVQHQTLMGRVIAGGPSPGRPQTRTEQFHPPARQARCAKVETMPVRGQRTDTPTLARGAEIGLREPAQEPARDTAGLRAQRQAFGRREIHGGGIAPNLHDHHQETGSPTLARPSKVESRAFGTSTLSTSTPGRMPARHGRPASPATPSKLLQPVSATASTAISMPPNALLRSEAT